MIWRLLTLLILAAAAVTWGILAKRDPGYVLIHYGEWSLESTLSLFSLALGITFILLYALLRFGGGLFRLPRRIGRWRTLRKAARARAGLNQAVTAAAQGHWKQAERIAMESLRHSDLPQLHLLTAAAAAQGMGDEELRDRHIYQAMDALPEAEGAAGLLHAQWLIDDGKYEQALATLLRLKERQPRTPRITPLLARCHYALGDWGELRVLLDELDGGVPNWEREEMEEAAYQGLMRLHAEGNDPEGLRTLWKGLPQRLRDNEALAAHYAERLMACETAVDVEQFLRRRLEEQWSEALVLLYGELETQLEAVPLLNRAEGWLREGRERDGALLLTCGRLALAARLWGKARGYLEASLSLQPRLEGYRLLARTLEQMGEREALGACRREALEKL